jgi:hypothetical protein
LIERYAIGDRCADLVQDAGVGMTITIQHRQPKESSGPNWLPTPDGAFYLSLRMYMPDHDVLDTTCHPASTLIRSTATAEGNHGTLRL